MINPISSLFLLLLCLSSTWKADNKKEEEDILAECNEIIATLQFYISVIADKQKDDKDRISAKERAETLFYDSDSTTIQISTLRDPSYKPRLRYYEYFYRLKDLNSYEKVLIDFENCGKNKVDEVEELLKRRYIEKIYGTKSDYRVSRYYCQKFRGYKKITDIDPDYSDFTIKEVIIEAKKSYKQSNGKSKYDIKIKRIDVSYTFPLLEVDNQFRD